MAGRHSQHQRSLPRARAGTVDNDSSRGAPALGHDVLGHAGVISSVQQPGLLDDEVVINGDQEVGVLGGINDILVPQPLHLAGKEGMGNDRDYAITKTTDVLSTSTTDWTTLPLTGFISPQKLGQTRPD